MIFLFALVMVAGVTGIRTYCDGGNCTFNSDCTMPSGTGGTLTGRCCSSTCYANYPKVAKGGDCNTADPCMGCAAGLSCANSAGQIQGGVGVSGPFTCQPIISKFSVGCKCDNDTQCITGTFCGSQNSVCMPNSLYSDSGCDFGVQCLSGYCDGSCRGRDLLVPNSCTSNNVCPLGKLCSKFGVPGTSMCHDLSAIGGACYSVLDCSDYYGQLNTNVECVKTAASDVGRCTRASNLGEVCSTSSTTTKCAWYSQDNGDGTTSQNRYLCNTTENPPRCRQFPLANVGGVCDSKLLNVSKCVPTAYCELNTKQPCTCCTNNCPNPGVCSTKFNIPLGGNCSDLNVACAKPNVCTKKTNATYYTCTAPVNAIGTTCNHTSTVLDSIQCYDDANGGINLYCACNNTCQKPISGGSQCSSQRQNLDYSTILNNFPPTATPAVALYDKHKENLLAYEYCCSYCTSQTERAKMTSDTGVAIDCAARTITNVQVCSSAATIQPYLQNCDSFTAAGTMATASLYLIALLSFLSIFILV